MACVEQSEKRRGGRQAADQTWALRTVCVQQKDSSNRACYREQQQGWEGSSRAPVTMRASTPTSCAERACFSVVTVAITCTPDPLIPLLAKRALSSCACMPAFHQPTLPPYPCTLSVSQSPLPRLKLITGTCSLSATSAFSLAPGYIEQHVHKGVRDRPLKAVHDCLRSHNEDSLVLHLTAEHSPSSACIRWRTASM